MLGSPPHTRGTLRNKIIEIWEGGITPAYAGNTIELVVTSCEEEDHPRIRGEHLIFYHFSIDFLGSPPHTRGTQFFYFIISIYFRITPAYAGNTYFR